MKADNIYEDKCLQNRNNEQLNLLLETIKLNIVLLIGTLILKFYTDRHISNANLIDEHTSTKGKSTHCA